ALERKTAMFAAEVARGELRRSSLNDYLDTSRDASSQLVANLNRAAELITSFKQVAADRNYSDQRNFDLGDLTEQVVMSLRPCVRSVLHDTARSGRHRPRPAHRLQHRDQSARRPARPRFRTRRRHANPDHFAAGSAAGAGCGIAVLSAPSSDRLAA